MTPAARKLLFGLLCVAQLAVPLSLVLQHERTRSEGGLWRFQTAPVDPADPFRGRYVRLAFAAELEPVPMADTGLIYIREETRMYAELQAGAEGFARLRRLHQQRPADAAYLEVFVRHMRHEESPEQRGQPPAAYVRLPFDRYYLPEARAPLVEAEYARAGREARERTWAEVRVRAGHAALARLVLDGKPVE